MSDSTTVQILSNGPIRVSGAFRVTDASGAAFDLAGRTAVALCRCGQSKNSPFCDGAHGAAGFKSESKARALPASKVGS